MIPLVLLLAAQLQPVSATRDEHKELVKKGVAAHDAGDYKAAVALYRSVLTENPSDIGARYEMTYSLFMAKDWNGCAEEASRASRYDSQLRAAIYSVWASCLDEASKPEEALKVFDEAIAQTVPSYLLHFNRAVTLFRVGRVDESRKGFQSALALNPRHPSSHAFLSEAYSQQKYDVPALLAACRFLVLEPNTPRSPKFAKQVIGYLNTKIQKKPGSSDLTILVSPTVQKDEGDFNAVDMSLALGMAVRAVKEKEKDSSKSEVEKIASAMKVAFSTLSRVKPEGFAASHYGRYFAALEVAGHTEAFAHYALISADLTGTREWLRSHQTEVDAFLAWTAGYKFVD